MQALVQLILVAIALMSVVMMSMSSKANELIKCQPSPDPEMSRYIQQTLTKAQKSLRCSDLVETKGLLIEALEGVEYMLANAQSKGICYTKANCKRKVSAQLVTLDHCKSTGIAESWIQTSPTTGTCINF